MRRRLAFLCFLAIVAARSAPAQWAYPPTRTVDASDTYFGRTYADPYRWLEDLKSAEVQEWFKKQADLTDGALARIPAAGALVEEWMDLDKRTPAVYTNISFENGRVFYKKTLGGENVAKAYVRKGWNGPERLLYDASTYKPGVTTTIDGLVPSWDGRYVALAFSAHGAEFSELRVLDVEKGTLLPESTFPSYGIQGWTPDSKAFFYDAGKVADTKSPDIELNRKARLHRVGTDFASDVDVLSTESTPDLALLPKEFPVASIDASIPDWVVGAAGTVENELKMFVAPASDLRSGRLHWSVLCRPSDKLVGGLAFHKGYAYGVTHAGAPRYRVVRTSLTKPDWAHAETVVPEAKDSVQTIVKSRDFLFVVYSDGINGRVARVDLATGKAGDVALPASGAVAVACPDAHSNRCLVWVSAWTRPTAMYDLDGAKATLATSVFDTGARYPELDALVAEEVEVPGHDGTPVPLSIIHRKDIRLDGNNSCILRGYGAYGISARPSFDPRSAIALHGVVLAVAHPRGGSEKGEAWYRAGFKTTKPNTWKDFISCAEYLVKKGYTSPGRLAGTGTSAGGILISRAVTSRPDLFAAAVCNVGCANAMRMEFSPNGPINTPEFGTVADPAECAALYEMDGVQHVQNGVKYPAVLSVAGWNDPRVPAWQPGKFAAALQSANASGKPVFLKINYDNGHFTEEKLVTFRNFAVQVAFMLWQTGHNDFQPAPPR